MNRILSLISGLLLLQIVATAQKTPAEIKADKLYEGFSYIEAIGKYRSITGRTLDGTRKLADCYRLTDQSDSAEKFYRDVVSASESVPRDYYWLSEVLMMNGKYDEADEWKSKYINKLIGSESEEYEFKGYYKKLLEDKGTFKLRHLAINSAEQDFGCAYYGEKVVFASTRQEDVKIVERKYNWNLMNFLDMFVADIDADGNLSNPTTFSKQYNSKFHEGPAVFSKDGNFMIFTRNNYEATDAQGVRKLKLFYAKKRDGIWEKPQEFPHNSNEYSVGHPSLSTDGTALYFSSDMPGGVGGVDIYKCTVTADTIFGAPVNLGKSVNTEYDEMFPFIHQSGYLFFSSDGWPGLGGLDVFYTAVSGDSYSGSKNLGTPVNDRKDDFAFVLDPQMKFGFLSSNRPGGAGDDDIYALEMLKPLKIDYKVSGHTLAKSDGSVVPGAVVNLKNELGELVASVTSDSAGYFEFAVEKDKPYTLVGAKADYFDGTNSVAKTELTDDKPTLIKDLTLEKDPGLSLYCLITDKTTSKPLSDVKITLTDGFTKKEEVFTTSAAGDFRRVLSEYRINDKISFEVTVECKGYLSKTVNYAKHLTQPGQYNMHEELDLTMDKIDVGADLAKIIDIKPIYFDLAKYNIRKDAAIELDKIVKVMNENPEMEVELGSHTDCRSSAASNEKLSDNRAKASAKYIKDKISNPERIYGKGFGETQLLNGCACEGAVKSSCSEAEHQLNRRTEFKIIRLTKETSTP